MKNKNLILSLFATALLVVSCNDTDDATGHSNLPVEGLVNANLTTDFSTSVNNVVNEDDEDVFTMTVTLDKAQPVDVYLNVEQVGGTATEGDDFELSRIIVPAYSLVGTGTVKILSDTAPEVSETLELKIADLPYNVSLASKNATFTIVNYLSDELHLDFKYNKSFLLPTGGGNSATNSLCGILYDFDFYLLDSNLADTGDYQAAGGSCEESMVLDASLADGTYYIALDLYDTGDTNGGANSTTDGIERILHLPFSIPLSINYSKDGGISPGNYAVHPAYNPVSSQSRAAYSTSVSNAVTAGTIDGNIIRIEKSTVNGHAIFTLSDPMTLQVLASGKTARPNISEVLKQIRAKRNK